jgi:hypothetical protein
MYYKYKVGWYNSYDDKEEYSEGVVFAADWGQAANRVSNSYGKDQIFEMNNISTSFFSFFICHFCGIWGTIRIVRI